MSEIQIWEHVIKWGIAQNPELPSDITNYSKNDFKTLKNTLQQCIPFIKFNNLTSKEFMDQVLPYEKIFSKDLYRDLLKTFLSLSDPNSKPSDKSKPHITKEIKPITVDSKIIKYQHAELISKWIDRLEITDKLTSSYEFKLVFRGSGNESDSYNCEKFHEICDNKSRTVVIVKVKDSSEILGGYNPIEWKSNDSFETTKDSFIFSFKYNDKIDDHILSRVIEENNAIGNWSFFGASFGRGDLCIWNKFDGNFCIKRSYEKLIRKTESKFVVEECEVFQIVSYNYISI